MTDHDALYAAVLAHPDDNTPRLVLADWLDDQGDAAMAARAEFIRAQLELARGVKHNHRQRDFGGDPGGCRACKLHRTACRWVESEAGGKAEYRASFSHTGDVWYGGHGLGVDGGVWVEWSHGFVGEVRLPLSLFMAGFRCPCVRHVDEDHDAIQADCPWCKGLADYRTPGLAADLFRAHPITRVALTDREPGQYGNTREWYWTEWTPDVTYPVSTVPQDVFGLLDGDTHVSQLGTRSKHYPDRAAALAALSAACVACGRALAAKPAPA